MHRDSIQGEIVNDETSDQMRPLEGRPLADVSPAPVVDAQFTSQAQHPEPTLVGHALAPVGHPLTLVGPSPFAPPAVGAGGVTVIQPPSPHVTVITSPAPQVVVPQVSATPHHAPSGAPVLFSPAPTGFTPVGGGMGGHCPYCHRTTPVNHSGYTPATELVIGGLIVIGDHIYKVEQLGLPKKAEPPKKDEAPKAPPPPPAPAFSAAAPEEVVRLFRDVWTGKHATPPQSPIGLLASCNEALLLLLARLEKKADLPPPPTQRPRRGLMARLFAPTVKPLTLRERINRLVDKGVLLGGVKTAAARVLPANDNGERRSAVQLGLADPQPLAGDIDEFINLLWQMLDQGFDQALWSAEAKVPPRVNPPAAPPPAAKLELPPGAAVLHQVGPANSRQFNA